MKRKFRPGKKITDLFTEGLWRIDTASCSKGYAKLVRLVRIIRITIDSFFGNKMGFQCVALSYFSLLALIPLFGLVFAVALGLGLPDNISGIIFRIFPANPEFAGLVIEKAEVILESVKAGGTGIISAFLFVWGVVWMMFQVERVFNNVWGISHIPRKIYKRFGYYILMLILIPLIIIIFGAGIAFYTNLPHLFGLDVSNLRFIIIFLGYVVLYCITVITLAAMYTFIPATKVYFKNAVKAASIDAVVFIVFQYIYLELQVTVSRLNNIYGIIAALPFFLIWMNASWQIIIYGAELTYGFQNVEKYNSHDWDS